MALTEFDPKIIVKPTTAEVVSSVAQLFEQVVYEAVEKNGVCNVALSGGTTPHMLYQRLACDTSSSLVAWEKIRFFFGDERDVSHDHVESNYHTAQRNLLDFVPVNPGNVFPMPADCQDIENAAAEYEQIIRRNVPPDPSGIPMFDLILLGMGADGHTASLFPYTDALDETRKLVVAYFVPVLGRNRMTFTFPLINAAANVVVLVTGMDKAETVASLLNPSDPSSGDFPISKVAPNGEFILAADAASMKFVHAAKP